MPTVKIPLVGVPHARLLADSDVPPGGSSLDQLFINTIFKKELNPITGAQRVRVSKRPGFGDGGTIASVVAPALGACALRVPGDEAVFAVWVSSTANNIRATHDSTASANESVTGPVSSSRPVLLNIDGTPKFYFHIITVLSTSKSAFISSTASTPTLTAQTDADLPESTLIGSFAGLDGYLFVAVRDGGIYNFDLNSDTAVTATSFIDPHFQQYGRGVFNYKDKIGLFTDDTIEFYENVGNPTGSPLQRIDHLTRRGFGLNIGANITTVDTSERYLSALDTVFWVNNPITGKMGVYMLDEFRPVKISSPDLDSEMSRIVTRSMKIIGVFSMYGAHYLALHMDDDNYDYWWVYCLDLGTWAKWESPLSTTANTLPAAFINRTESTGGTDVVCLLGDSLFVLDIARDSASTTYFDRSSTVTATIQTRVLDFGTNNRKRFKSISLLGPDPREASTCVVTTSVDDGATFSNSRSIDLDTDDRRIFRQGVARRIQWRIQNKTDAPMDLEEMEVDYEEMDR